MAKDGKRGLTSGRTRIDWPEIRAVFESGCSNVSELSRRFGVQRESIQRHRDAENWQSVSQVSDRVTDNVVDIMTRRQIEITGPVIEQAVAARIQDILVGQPALFAKLQRWADVLAEDGLNGTLMPGTHQSKADVFNATLNGVKQLAAMSRDDAGLRLGQASVSRQDDAKPTSLRIKIAPQPIVDNDVASAG